MQVLYFAYGSNMSTRHLRCRIPSVKSIGISYLKDEKVVFNKRSVDNSGKANLVYSLGDVTWGVLYDIDCQDLKRLDEVEGGYKRVPRQVWKTCGNVVKAETYVSTKLTDDPRAYECYKELVLSGAREHNLPRDYIAFLEGLPSKPCSKSETAG